ncbi:WecB/TagA/CpsF family glycosyltransferase [Aliiroseovarius sp.]|uniref:WecB/TagA/CpsF family glycosyltransferase n=1 Tax=Aliiroseovarius sp. TaxID=1872442 RepID=UPI002628B6FB|nr:WecB/TagA/CpsF family glycosyltransferase [Aliiroseovarius sp.]
MLGIPISVVTLDTAAEALVRWAGDERGRYVGAREVASVMAMHEDPELLAVTRGADMNLPDGMPLVWIARRRGLPVSRAGGPDLMERMLREGGENGLKHFFYGGKEGVADKLADRFRREVPGVQIVGTYCPPFRRLTAEEDARVVAMVRESGANVVWVGISSPKQDVWMAEHVDQLPVTMLGVGAAFDFLSGEIRRAPGWMQKSGLESVFRLMTDFRRLWHRYLVLAPRFVFKVLFVPQANRAPTRSDVFRRPYGADERIR